MRHSRFIFGTLPVLLIALGVQPANAVMWGVQGSTPDFPQGPSHCPQLEGRDLPSFPCEWHVVPSTPDHVERPLLPDHPTGLSRRQARAYDAWRTALAGVVAASWDQAAAYAVWCHELAFGDDDTSAVAIEQAARETLQARLTANRGPTNAAQLTILAATHVVEAHQRFLLDELTYLDAHIKFTQTLYQTDFTTVPEDLPAPPEPPLRDHHRALDLYRAVIAEHPNAPEAEVALMMVGALLSDPNGPPNQDRTEQAYEAYTSLVDRYPDSPWASDAARLAGEIDAFERNDQRTAIGHFERALASAPDERRVELALYRLAHSHYRYASAERDAHYDKALDHFWRLLALSEQHHRHTGAYLCLHEEAVVYTAMTIADISKNEGVPALDAAQRVLQSRAGLDSAWAIQAELASILIKRARYDEAIELCEWLAASAAEQTIE